MASPIPEGTSGYGSATADLQDHGSTETTPDPETLELSTEAITHLSQAEMTPPDNEPTQADDSPSTLHVTSGEAPTEGTGK